MENKLDKKLVKNINFGFDGSFIIIRNKRISIYLIIIIGVSIYFFLNIIKNPLRTHYGIDASTGTRVGLESTRIIRGATSLFYKQSNGLAPGGIPLLSTSFFYRR